MTKKGDDGGRQESKVSRDNFCTEANGWAPIASFVKDNLAPQR